MKESKKYLKVEVYIHNGNGNQSNHLPNNQSKIYNLIRKIMENTNSIDYYLLSKENKNNLVKQQAKDKN